MMVHDVEERCNLLRIKKDKSAFWEYHGSVSIIYVKKGTFSTCLLSLSLSQRMLFRFVAITVGL